MRSKPSDLHLNYTGHLTSVQKLGHARVYMYDAAYMYTHVPSIQNPTSNYDNVCIKIQHHWQLGKNRRRRKSTNGSRICMKTLEFTWPVSTDPSACRPGYFSHHPLIHHWCVRRGCVRYIDMTLHTQIKKRMKHFDTNMNWNCTYLPPTWKSLHTRAFLHVPFCNNFETADWKFWRCLINSS